MDAIILRLVAVPLVIVGRIVTVVRIRCIISS